MSRLTNFKQFSNEKSGITIKELLKIPTNLNTVFDICKNEIKLIDDLNAVSVFTRIFVCCILESKGLTHKNVDFINQCNKILTKSETKTEAKKQLKIITSPENIFSALLLKMITDTKKIEVENSDINKRLFSPLDAISKLIEEELTDKKFFKEYYYKKIINSKIIIK